MLRIKEYKIIEVEDAYVCQALVYEDEKFECFIERYEDTETVEYCASNAPHRAVLNENEEYIDEDYIEYFVVSDSLELSEFDGLDESKYISAYRMLDERVAEYKKKGL